MLCRYRVKVDSNLEFRKHLYYDKPICNTFTCGSTSDKYLYSIENIIRISPIKFYNKSTILNP